jgi:hypothetical protein
MAQNYLNEADTDDEDEKCNITSSPEEVAEAQLKSLDLKGAMVLSRVRKQVTLSLLIRKTWIELRWI